jgi:hypothetical protein
MANALKRPHGDLIPDNILVLPDGEVKFIDPATEIRGPLDDLSLQSKLNKELKDLAYQLIKKCSGCRQDPAFLQLADITPEQLRTLGY